MDKYVSLAIGGIACATAIPLDNEIINFKMTVNRYLRVLWLNVVMTYAQ